MGNRIRLGGTWHHIPDLGTDISPAALSRCHSVEYEDGYVWQLAFGNVILELTPKQAAELAAQRHWCKARNDCMTLAHGNCAASVDGFCIGGTAEGKCHG